MATALWARRCLWASGLLFANKYRGNKNVAMTYYGDGAANQARSMNLQHGGDLETAGDLRDRKQPLCHGTAATRSTAEAESLGARGDAMAFPTSRWDGMDVRAVKDAADRAMEHCRSGKGPYILEMMTYRYRGHSMSDPAKYRTKEEVQKMREEHDPIEQVKGRLLRANQATKEDLKKIDAEIRDIVTKASDFATNDPLPDESELWTDIYVNA